MDYKDCNQVNNDELRQLLQNPDVRQHIRKTINDIECESLARTYRKLNGLPEQEPDAAPGNAPKQREAAVSESARESRRRPEKLQAKKTPRRTAFERFYAKNSDIAEYLEEHGGELLIHIGEVLIALSLFKLVSGF